MTPQVGKDPLYDKEIAPVPDESSVPVTGESAAIAAETAPVTPDAAAPVQEAPAPQAPPATQPASSYAVPNSLLDRFNLVIGGGYNFGTTVGASAEPFHSKAPEYTGFGFFLQPSFSVFKPGSAFDVRVGANVDFDFLSIPRSQGSVDSSITSLALAGLVEGSFKFQENFKAGLNASLSYTGLFSSNADVGAPFRATFDFTQQGGLGLGAQLFVSAFDVARAGLSFEAMPAGFSLPTAPGQPDLLVEPGTTVSIFAGLDVLGILKKSKSGEAKAAAPVSK